MAARSRSNRFHHSKHYYVWLCTSLSCQWKDESPDQPEICSVCQSVAILTLKCSCGVFNDKNEVRCKICRIKLNPKISLVDYLSKEQTKQNNKFLQACCYGTTTRFNTNKQNSILLLYGFINKNVSNDCYKNTPLDIVNICIAFCYNFCDIPDVEDVFDGILMSKYRCNFLLSENNTKLCWIANNCEKVDAYGKCKLSRKVIRKLWKIKLIKKTDCEEECQSRFKIGIAMKQATEQCYQISVNGDKGLLQADCGDIISLLYVKDDINVLNGELRFAVNGFGIRKKLKIPASVSAKILCVTMFDPCFDLKILHQ
eukprot:271824_1